MMKSVAILVWLLFTSVDLMAQKAILDEANTLEIPIITINEKKAGDLFAYFQSSDLFIWKDGNNCEDRANAVSLILDGWNIPNLKVWLFTGEFLDRGKGKLLTVEDGQNDNKKIPWKFHVAVAVPYKQDDKILFTVIDPSTLDKFSNIEIWADKVTFEGPSYYFLTDNDYYMWNKKGKSLTKATFNRRNNTNYQWTIQGLAGFNGLNGKHERIMKTDEGKAKLKLTQEKLENIIKNKAF